MKKKTEVGKNRNMNLLYKKGNKRLKNIHVQTNIQKKFTYTNTNPGIENVKQVKIIMSSHVYGQHILLVQMHVRETESKKN